MSPRRAFRSFAFVVAAAVITTGMAWRPLGALAQSSQETKASATDNVRALVEQADRFWSERNYRATYPLYLQAAQAGQAHAMTRVGFLYDRGYAVRQDYAEAVRWYQRGVRAGDVQAMAYLGGMYADGAGVPVDYSQALSLFHKAADQGEPTAMTKLGLMYFQGHGVPRDPAEAARWYQKAADLGDMYAMSNLANMYLMGAGVSPSAHDALQWYRKAAGLGEASSMVMLGQIYATGSLGVAKDPAEAQRWLQKAADLGNPQARESLARFGKPTFDLNGDWAGYFASPAIPTAIRITQTGNKISAIWLRTDDFSATNLPFLRGNYDGDSPTGQVEIAEYNGLLGLLAFANSGSQSAVPPSAWGIATLGIEDPDHIHFGNTPAFERITAPRVNDLHCNPQNPLKVKAFFAYTRGVQFVAAKDYETAVCWFQIGAAQGSVESMTGLGVLLHDGLGVDRNYPLALQLLQQASNVDPNAAFALAGMYDRGEGTASDKGKAEFWRGKAREIKSQQEKETIVEKKKEAIHKAELQNIDVAVGGFVLLLQQMNDNDTCQPQYVKDGNGGYYDANERERGRRIAEGTLKCSVFP
jgi:TPR repeat protein